MKNKTILFSIFAFVGLMLFSGAANVSAQDLPGGSYQNTCRNMSFTYHDYKVFLVAECRKKNESYVKSTLDSFYLCTSDGITNENGVLTCNKSESLPAFQTAQKVVPKAVTRMYGYPERMSVHFFISNMFARKSDKQYYAGLTDQVAMDFLRDYLSAPGITYDLKPIVQRAVHDVYGRDAYDEYDKYLPRFVSKTTSYEQIWALEMMTLNGKDNVQRKLAIGHAFKDARDKPPNKDEREQWLKRTESYSQMVEILRKQ